MKKIILICLFYFSYTQAYSQWKDVGGGIDLWVNVMQVDSVNDLLYVGGAFNSAGGFSTNSIAIWNGNNWSAVGNNEIFTGVGSINDILLYNGDLIVAGSFDSVGNNWVRNIARFDGTQWLPMGNGFDDIVYSLEVYNGEIYAAGFFFHSGLDTIPHIAKWNGNSWERVSNGLYGGAIHSMKVFNNKLCVAGEYFYTLNNSYPCIATWDGSDWDSLGNGFNNYVIKLGIFLNELYAVGDFTPWAMNPSTRISKWDGISWQPMPFPTGGNEQQITDLTEYHNKLYICGLFNQPPDLGRYNGFGYDSLCNVSGFINSLAVYKNEIYVGGLFNSLNGTTINSIARYNDGVGINFPSHQKNILVYPNPVTDVLRVSLPELSEVSLLEIFDAYGKRVFEKTIPAGLSATDLDIKAVGLPGGVYKLRITHTEEVTASLLIVQ